jgi:hypothetical protein
MAYSPWVCLYEISEDGLIHLLNPGWVKEPLCMHQRFRISSLWPQGILGSAICPVDPNPHELQPKASLNCHEERYI